MVEIRSKLGLLIQVSVAALLVAGCSSSAVRAKREQRDKALQTSKLYCEFVNGENNPTDVDVALNVSMQTRCDYEKPFSLTTYKTPSEVQGIVYCCGIIDKNAKKDDVATAKSHVKEAKPEPKAEAKIDSSLDLTPEIPSAPSLPSSSSAPKLEAKKPELPKKDNSPYQQVPELDP